MNPMSKTSGKQLKICIIASTYPRYEADYAVPWLRESVRRLVERGHQVSILAPSYQGLTDHAIDGVPVHRFRYSPARWERLTHEEGAPNRIRNPLFQLLAAPYVGLGCRAAARLAAERQFDIIHAHWPFPHEPIASAAAKVCGAPLVLTCHGAEFAIARRKSWVQPLLRKSLLKGDALIANSTHTAQQIKNSCGRDALVLPYGTTVSAKPATAQANPKPRILFTGRLIPRKGVQYLIEAMPHVLGRFDAELIICGDGDCKPGLQRLTQSLGLEKNISFLGFVSNERLDEEYARCDIWVNPSIVDDRGDTEGLGVGAIEAYAHRKPVVASRVGGIPDAVVSGETGYLVAEKDEFELADAILQLLNNPAQTQAMGQAGYQFAQTRFHWETITDSLESVYYQLLGQARPSLPQTAEDLPELESQQEKAVLEECV